MSKEIKIGKHTLESLTTGMYEDPKIIFREYIQNSTDSIDNAISQGLLKNRNEGKIEVDLDEKGRTIRIKDNGLGVSVDEAWSKLCDVGNSSKHHSENRGFRGIGRLGGLSYAKELLFVTSCAGENKKSIVKWDCVRLKELLQPGKFEDYDLIRVIDEVAIIELENEAKDVHYFEVILKGVDNPELIDEKTISSYLSETAPIPFDAQRFPFYLDSKSGIKTKLQQINKPLEEYLIYLNKNPDPVYKPYKTWFTAKNTKDDIQRIEHILEYDDNGDLLFWGWYALTNFLGQVQEKEIRGLRVRKDNILIGGDRTLDVFFTQTRFNFYFIGEIYVYDKDVIPNARRDNFELNEAFYRLKEKLEKHTRNHLSKYPLNYSNTNTAINNINKSEKELSEIQQKLANGLTSENERKKLEEKQERAVKRVEESKNILIKAQTKLEDYKRKEIESVLNKVPVVEQKKKEIVREIENVDLSVNKDRFLSHYSKDERKLIIKILEIVDRELEGQVCEELKNKIIEGLKQKSKQK